MLASGDSVNIGEINSGHMVTDKACLHISSSTGGTDDGGPVLLRVDHADQPGSEPPLFVTGSGRVGFGTSDPTIGLHIKSNTGTGINIQADTDNTPESTDRTAWLNMTSDNGSTRCVVGTTNGDDADPYGTFLDGALPNTVIIGARSANVPLHFVTSNRIKTTMDDSGHFGVGQGFNRNNLPTAIVHISGSSANIANNSPLLNVAHDDNNNILFVTGSGRVGIGTDAPEHTLSVSGSAAFSGTFGSTAFETIAATSGIANVTTGTTILDVTSQANNAFYSFAVADGAFPGQQKNFIFKSTFGGSSANTNGLQLTGSNIATSIAGTSTGIIIMSASEGEGGYFGAILGSAMLMWDGSKWNVMANVNTQVSAS